MCHCVPLCKNEKMAKEKRVIEMRRRYGSALDRVQKAFFNLKIIFIRFCMDLTFYGGERMEKPKDKEE